MEKGGGSCYVCACVSVCGGGGEGRGYGRMHAGMFECSLFGLMGEKGLITSKKLCLPQTITL